MGKKMAWSRKTIALLLVCSVTVLSAGCRGEPRDVTKKEGAHMVSSIKTGREDRLQVVATIFPYYDFVREIAGDLADVTMIVPAGMDTHSFEPSANDMITIGGADVLIYNGGEMEGWVPKVLEAAENPGILADAMIDYVDTFAEEHVEGMTRREHHEEETGEASDNDTGDEADEHIWTSPVNAGKIAAQIAKDLAQADPAHQEEYLGNAQVYLGELDKLHRKFQRVTGRAENRYLVFGDRFPLRYFVEEYGLEYTAAFSGCSSETEPGAGVIAYLTDQVKEKEIPVVLKIELTSPRVAESIAEAAGARVETFSTCHNVTKEEFRSGVTYIRLMEQNLSVLKAALSAE